MQIRSALAHAMMTSMLLLVSLGYSRAQMPTSKTNLDIKQPDRVLFKRATKAMNESKYAESRILLESLISSHPDSDYVPRAKLSIGDAWYAEGNFKQADMEYQDLITFFPNRPEVLQAKLKIASIRKRTKM
jgi:outer membrane protein assembly factor BamD (BamD/ComL family)